jgi:hypothetical protein
MWRCSQYLCLVRFIRYPVCIVIHNDCGLSEGGNIDMVAFVKDSEVKRSFKVHNF